MIKLQRRALAGALVAALAFTGAACSDDDDDTAETGSAADETTTTAAPEDEETTTTEGDAGGEVVEVTAIDYGYEGLPDTVAPGTRFSLTNAGTEPHEFVAILIPASETRSVGEIAALPEEEQAAIFGGEPEPATVILAATGTTDTPGAVVGDGTLTEPGRYAVVCFLPVGSTDEILNAEGPPVSDDPPHASQGMFGEVTVA